MSGSLRFVLALASVAALITGAACGLQLSGTETSVEPDASLGAGDASNPDGSADAVAADGSVCDQDVGCGVSIVQLVGSGFHFCARTRVGDAFCWGRNFEGQLGVGDVSPHTSPVRVSRATDGGSFPPFVQISAGYFHTCGRTADDAVYCWGANQYGQVGQPLATANAAAPSRVGTLFAGQIAAGGAHSCAVDHALRVQCWGYNANAQLGYTPGSRADAGEIGCMSATCNPQPTPASIADAPLQLALAYLASCAIIADGGVACWGNDLNGELADPARMSAVARPLVVSLGDAGALRGVTALAGTYFSFCAIAGDSVGRCWGSNANGNLGSPPSGPIFVPQPFGTSMNAAAIAAGTAHTCIVANGRVLCAGWNGEGELGNGVIGGDAACPTFAGPQTPNQCVVGFVDVGLTNVVEVAANLTATCARTNEGKVYCWGENGVGQLGHAPDTNGDVPCNGTVGPASSRCNALPVEVLPL